jgi:hypothetical protein
MDVGVNVVYVELQYRLPQYFIVNFTEVLRGVILVSHESVNDGRMEQVLELYLHFPIHLLDVMHN